MELNVKERILSIRLMDHIEQNLSIEERLGISAKFVKRI